MTGVKTDANETALTLHSDERWDSGVQLLHLTKSFAGRKVLDDVGFKVPSGTVVGLLGQNGSGKSTLIKLLAGYHDPDHGCGAAVVVRGSRSDLPIRAGEFTVAAVHQDLALVDAASVAENLLIAGLPSNRVRTIRWSTVHQKARRMLAACGAADIDPRTLVGELRPVQRAAVAIARAVESIRDGGLLILDEVTAFLPNDAVEQLFGVVRELTSQGISVLFVSHRMEEVFDICDRAVVLRSGRLVSDVRLADTSEAALITDIVGESLDWLYPDKHPAGHKVQLAASALRGDGLKGVTFDAKEGEIVGLTGLKGMGYERLVYALYGEGDVVGSLAIDGTRAAVKSLSPRRALQMGIRLVPSERLKNGAVASATVRENASLPHLGQFFQNGVLNGRAERRWASEVISSYRVDPPQPDQLYGTLSGGNQQKVLLARWLETKPKILLLDEPTQGVDVGARREIFSRIVAAAQQGVTILYATTEAQDLAELCHRVLIFRDGGIAGELCDSEVTETNISRLCWATGIERGGSDIAATA